MFAISSTSNSWVLSKPLTGHVITFFILCPDSKKLDNSTSFRRLKIFGREKSFRFLNSNFWPSLKLISSMLNSFNIFKNKYEESKSRILAREYVALIQGSIMMMNLYDDSSNYLQVGEKLISLI